MKQQFKICRECPYYLRYKKGLLFRKKFSFCKKDNRFFLHRPKGLPYWWLYVKDGEPPYIGFEDKDFEKVDVGEDCIFYTEYCLFELNKE